MSERYGGLLVPGVEMDAILSACAALDPWVPGAAWYLQQTSVGVHVVVSPEAESNLAVLDRWPFWVWRVDTAGESQFLRLQRGGSSVHFEGYVDGDIWLHTERASWWADTLAEAERELAELAARSAREAATALGVDVLPTCRGWRVVPDPFTCEPSGPVVVIGRPPEPEAEPSDDDIPW